MTGKKLNNNNKTSWKNINWRQLKTELFEKQKEIYALNKNKNENIEIMNQKQKELMYSYDTKLLAVRKVTQENRGKKTAKERAIK